MPTHLTIKANGHPLTLPQDFSLDIEDSNPLFNDNEMFTYPVSLPLEGNRHLLQNMEDIHSDLRPVNIEHTPMTIIVDGIPYRSGVAVVSESEELKDQVSFNIQSMRESLDDRISDLQCRDIPVKDKIKIGEMVGDVKVRLRFKHEIRARFKEGNTTMTLKSKDWDHVTADIPLQALGFSYPFEADEVPPTDPLFNNHLAKRSDNGPTKIRNFINVSEVFPNKAYCNVRVCYKHNEIDAEGNTTGRAVMSGEYGPYYVLEADRPQSGVCFYVLYFFRCLFAHLGVTYDDSSLRKVEDLCRIFFFNTACKYDLVRKYDGESADFLHTREINDWISSRATEPSHCGKLEVVTNEKKSVNSFSVGGTVYEVGKTVDSHYTTQGLPKKLTMTECDIYMKEPASNVLGNIMEMYANSDNFPDEGVSSIVDSMWNAFGVKFLMDYETRSVRAILIRDVYRDTSVPIDLPCQVISVVKVSEKVTGVRMRYAAESDEKEQRENVKRGVRDYDTNFDYIDYSHLNTDLGYDAILQQQSSSDMTTYIDKATGNAYRIKVDSEATTVAELNARLFEVGGYKGVSLGDCSPINEDFVEELKIDWSPMLFSDVNISNEKKVGVAPSVQMDVEVNETPDAPQNVGTINGSYREQVLAAFLDEEMMPPNTVCNIDNAIGNDHGDAALREILTTDESYDPTATEDGNSPLQHADWGTAVAVMRGGGTDMAIQEYDQNYDGFGSSKWRTVAGKYASSSDSIDNWANDYDYNGEGGGIGPGERFSMKIRGYKNHPETGEPMCSKEPRVRNRGLYDTFMSEHANFLLHRKKYKITCRCEIAVLADIPNHWERRYTIGGVTGWINRISTRVSVREGLDLVEIEMYSL